MSKQGWGQHYCHADKKAGTFVLGTLSPCVWYCLGPAININSQETLYGNFQLLEQECKNLEKPWCQQRSYSHSDQAQSKTQNTEESLTQLMHMHHHALARLKNVEKSIDGLKDDLKDACNGDWYFWDFVNELHCGICNKDLDGAYRIPALPAEIPSTALAYGSGSKRMYMST
ncbi:hypothetical protein EDD18DRAFT_1109427 [Armillaria luteobubalina]|uniref:Uncharacterized protein n=1 Tax=Armillaria luteobubalina TaxID=153913 RepID=A0AA39PZK8_9AGAR|nr:hypothetical protein EDD18DRAFT_1109427 [Armillaria luteobubalina]